jgi:hypothetical protein
MIIAGYMGAVSVVTTVKWFWFLFGMAMFLPVVYSLARTFRETVITRKVGFLLHSRSNPWHWIKLLHAAKHEIDYAPINIANIFTISNSILIQRPGLAAIRHA